MLKQDASSTAVTGLGVFKYHLIDVTCNHDGEVWAIFVWGIESLDDNDCREAQKRPKKIRTVVE